MPLEGLFRVLFICYVFPLFLRLRSSSSMRLRASRRAKAIWHTLSSHILNTTILGLSRSNNRRHHHQEGRTGVQMGLRSASCASSALRLRSVSPRLLFPALAPARRASASLRLRSLSALFLVAPASRRASVLALAFCFSPRLLPALVLLLYVYAPAAAFSKNTNRVSPPSKYFSVTINSCISLEERSFLGFL